MKKNGLLLYFTLIIQISYSQEIDSTVYYSYLKDPGIDSIFHYSDYYNNGDLKEIGWKIRSKRNNSMFTFKDTTSIENLQYFEWKVGVYKYFFKKNRIQFIIDFPRDIRDTIRTELFNKKGELIYLTKTIRHHEYDPKCCDDIEKFNKDWPYRFHYFINYTKGKIESDGYYTDGYKKTGLWRKFNKHGELIEENYYDNDKKIKNPAANK